MSANWTSPIERALARALDAQTSVGPEAAEALVDTYPDLPELPSLLAVADRIKPALVATLPLAVQARHQRMMMVAIQSYRAARAPAGRLGPLVFRSGLSMALVVAMAMPGTLAAANHFAQKRRTELERLAGPDSSPAPPAAAAPGVTGPTAAAGPGQSAPAGAPAASPAPLIPALTDPMAPALGPAASPTVVPPGLPGTVAPTPPRRAASAPVPVGMPEPPSAGLATSTASKPSDPSPALTAPKGPATLSSDTRIPDVQGEDTAVQGADHKRRVGGKTGGSRSLRGEPGAGSRPTLRGDGPNPCRTGRHALRRAAAHPGTGADGRRRGCPATDTNAF